MVQNKSEFDWVKARSECSAIEVFERLRLSVKADADQRTQMLIAKGANYGFNAISEGVAISVFLSGPGVLRRLIVFRMTVHSRLRKCDFLH